MCMTVESAGILAFSLQRLYVDVFKLWEYNTVKASV